MARSKAEKANVKLTRFLEIPAWASAGQLTRARRRFHRISSLRTVDVRRVDEEYTLEFTLKMHVQGLCSAVLTDSLWFVA